MVLRSFRLRMALFTAIVSGLVLTVFGVLFMAMMRQIGLERIDRELHALGDAQVRWVRPRDHWRRFDGNLRSLFGPGNRKQIALMVTEARGAPVYLSRNWPSELAGGVLGIPASLTNAPCPAAPSPAPRDVGAETRLAPPRFLTAMAGGRTWRLAVLGNEDINLVVGQDLAEFDSELRWARHVTLAVAPPVLLLLAAGGWLLAVRALRPVRVLAHMTGGITARRLGRRVPASEADREFRDLIDTVNGMLDRLEKSFHQAARFSADAAHELKTPLTLLQGQLELAMRTAPADSPEQRTYAGLLEEVHRLKTIVTKLLLLAKADSEQLKLGLERLDLSREVEALCGDARGTAPGLTLRTDIAPGVAAMADRDLLQHAMGNLVSNAVAYNRENGVIEFRLRREGEKAVLTISNTTAPGTRLNPDRVFERFYRGDTAHSRQVDGVGLGLSLAREIARAHGGDLRLSDCREDWVSFDLSLPVAS